MNRLRKSLPNENSPCFVFRERLHQAVRLRYRMPPPGAEVLSRSGVELPCLAAFASRASCHLPPELHRMALGRVSCHALCTRSCPGEHLRDGSHPMLLTGSSAIARNWARSARLSSIPAARPLSWRRNGRRADLPCAPPPVLLPLCCDPCAPAALLEASSGAAGSGWGTGGHEGTGFPGWLCVLPVHDPRHRSMPWILLLHTHHGALCS